MAGGAGGELLQTTSALADTADEGSLGEVGELAEGADAPAAENVEEIVFTGEGRDGAGGEFYAERVRIGAGDPGVAAREQERGFSVRRGRDPGRKAGRKRLVQSAGVVFGGPEEGAVPVLSRSSDAAGLCAPA